MTNLILTLLVTVVVEFLILYIILRSSILKILFYSLLINSLTLPIATYIYQNLLENLFMVEILVIVAESILIMVLFEIDYKKALIISLIANGITALIGVSGLIK